MAIHINLSIGCIIFNKIIALIALVGVLIYHIVLYNARAQFRSVVIGAVPPTETTWGFFIGFIFWDSFALLSIVAFTGILVDRCKRDRETGKMSEINTSSYIIYITFLIMTFVLTAIFGTFTFLHIWRATPAVLSTALKILGYVAVCLSAATNIVNIGLGICSCAVTRLSGEMISLDKELNNIK